MSYKKGQQSPSSGGGVATLLGVITILIFLYIVFLPHNERSELLGSSTGSTGTGRSPSSSFKNVTLLLANPGQIDFVSSLDVEHDIPSLNLFTSTAGKAIEERDSIYVRRAIFSSQRAELSFSLADAEHTDRALLNFLVKEGKGRLSIFLNDNLIFDRKAPPGNINPIQLPRKFLQENNKLVFETDSPGVAFWRINEYSLERASVTADITDVSSREAESHFFVSSEETDNLDYITARFVPDCAAAKAGKLKVMLNSRQLFSGIPDCGRPFVQRYDSTYLQKGDNSITFITDGGAYLIDRIEVVSKLKKARDFIYDFTVNSTVLKDIQRADVMVNLSMEFTDRTEDKEAELVINGQKTALSTRDMSYSKTLDDFVKEGFNYVRIVPKESFYIAELKVAVAKG